MASSNLFDRINIRGYVDGWAKITIEKWQAELRKKKITVTDELYNSFEKEVKRKGADLAEVILKFKFYGRFVDIGVGNGISANERGSKTANRAGAKAGAAVSFSTRKPKRWINKIATSQGYRLNELLREKMAETVTSGLSSALNSSNIKYTING